VPAAERVQASVLPRSLPLNLVRPNNANELGKAEEKERASGTKIAEKM
jgi:hypothetical protein